MVVVTPKYTQEELKPFSLPMIHDFTPVPSKIHMPYWFAPSQIHEHSFHCSELNSLSCAEYEWQPIVSVFMNKSAYRAQSPWLSVDAVSPLPPSQASSLAGSWRISQELHVYKTTDWCSGYTYWSSCTCSGKTSTQCLYNQQNLLDQICHGVSPCLLSSGSIKHFLFYRTTGPY